MSYVPSTIIIDGTFKQRKTEAHEITNFFTCQVLSVLAVETTVYTDAKINFTYGPWRGRFYVMTGR
jgi:hypothetical protein